MNDPLLTLSGPFSLGMIWAEAHEGIIGAGGTLAWYIPADLAHFKATTDGYAVIHGRRSYDAIPSRFKPLPGRRNIVLTRSLTYEAPGAEVVHSLSDAFALIGDDPAWVVGGGQVYSEAMPRADVLVVSEVDLLVAGDTRAPRIDPRLWRPVQRTAWQEDPSVARFRVVEYRRR